MRLLHFSDHLYPMVTGGTEIFVHQLIAAQQRSYPDTFCLWGSHEKLAHPTGRNLQSQLLPHQCLLSPINSSTRLDQIATISTEINDFLRLLSTFCPDVVHLHSFSDNCGLSHARAVKSSGARLIVTVHSPGFTCIKGNLIDASGAVCDGVLRERRCTRCRLHNGGIPFPLAWLLALQDGYPLTSEAPGALAHVLTARQLTKAFQEAWLELVDLADCIHVLANWSRDILLRQGVPKQKVQLIRTAGPTYLPLPTRTHMQDGVLRLVYWGRCHPVKGIHFVIEAILALPQDSPVQLDFYGPYWDGDYGQYLLRRMHNDSRFSVHGNLPKDQLLPRLQAYDLAVIPSTWMETGPLTVLEAFAAGIPIAGSDLGGIRELLDGVQGCFRVPLQTDSWRKLLHTLLNQRSRPSFTPPAHRDFTALAQELLPAYQSSC